MICPPNRPQQQANQVGPAVRPIKQSWQTDLLLTISISRRAHEDAVFSRKPDVQVAKGFIQAGFVTATEDHHSCVWLIAEGQQAVVDCGVDLCHGLQHIHDHFAQAEQERQVSAIQQS